MSETRAPGSESGGAAPLAATWGGPGFMPRRASHVEEVAEGRLWLACGAASETAPLRHVLLSWPGEELCFDEDPDRWLMLERVDLVRLRRQTEAVAELFTAQGVEVHLYRPPRRPPPNLLFQRDLFLMTPEGAILARPASEQRAGEERFAAEALAQIGVPILGGLRGRGVFEGPDVLWLDRGTVLAGVGRRTSREGAAAVAALLRPLGVEMIEIGVPGEAQHLLGVVSFLDRDLAAIDAERASAELRRVLAGRGVELLELPADEELRVRRGMNFVALGPRRVVMPAGCPGIRRRFEAAGVETLELEVGEYVKAGGALGCLVGIVGRDEDRPGSEERSR